MWRTLQPKLAFLSRVVGMEPAALRKTVLRLPNLLAHSVDAKLQACILKSCMDVCVCVCVCVCVYVYICICIYLCICIHI